MFVGMLIIFVINKFLAYVHLFLYFVYLVFTLFINRYLLSNYFLDSLSFGSFIKVQNSSSLSISILQSMNILQSNELMLSSVLSVHSIQLR